MDKVVAGKTAVAWGVASLLSGFIIGYINLRWFFPLYFHGDAAAMQVLAEAMRQELSLLPADFNYGNQLILFRSSPFIALAVSLGLSGYEAFVAGSALCTAVWAVVLYVSLMVHFEDAAKGFLFAVLALVPVGWWELDYLLGQQSHLANAVLSVSSLVFAERFVKGGRFLSLCVLAVSVFLISVEAPMRAALLALPLALALPAYGCGRRVQAVAYAVLCSLGCAVFLNLQIQKSHTLASNYFATLTFKGVDDIAGNLAFIFRDAVDGVSVIKVYEGLGLSLPSLALYFCGIAFVLCMIAFGVAKGVVLVRVLLSSKESLSPYTIGMRGFLIESVAVMGVLSGAVIVACLNPDTGRHFLWALFVLKLCLIVFVFDRLVSILGVEWRAKIVVFFVCCVFSYWLALVQVHGSRLVAHVEARVKPEMVKVIKDLSVKHGVSKIYGEGYWRMMPLNSLVSGVEAVPLVGGNGVVEPMQFLTRPSWACEKGKVLYFIKGGDLDRVVERRLRTENGKELFAKDGEAIWLGDPVWSVPPGFAKCGMGREFDVAGRSRLWRACDLPTIIGEVLPGCKVGKKNISASGPLTYGPYQALPAGKYVFEIAYSSGSGEGRAGAWDVAIGMQGVALTSGVLPSAGGKVTGTFVIESAAALQPVQIRTLGESGVELVVEYIKISRVE